MAHESPFSTLFKLKDALDDPAKNMPAAKADPQLGPILSKLSDKDMETLRKIIADVKPLSFCNRAAS
jgi:hypothetical protein